MAQKMLVGDKDTVLLLPAYEINGVPQFALPSTGGSMPITDPTSALLNYFIPATAPDDAGAHWGGNITCAVIDDFTLALTDSATDDVRTICSVGQSQDLTFYNYDISMNFLRDIDPLDATSDFNLPKLLTSAPDIAYVVAHRVGYSRTVAAEIGQEWNFYYSWTDHSIPAAADGENQTLGQTFVPKGIINFKKELEA